MKNNLFSRFYYGTFGAVVFKQRVEEIGRANIQTLTAMSLWAAIMAAVVSGLSYIIEPLEGMHYVFLPLTAVALAMQLLCRTLFTKTTRGSLFTLYLFAFICLAAGAVAGTLLTPHGNATFFCAVLLLFPSFIVDKPGRIFLLMLPCALAFCWLTWTTKTTYYIYTDIVNAVAMYLLGGFSCRYFTRVKLNEILMTTQLNLQRQTDAIVKGASMADGKKYISGALSQGRGLCLLMVLDMDYFATVNELFGRARGDRLLERAEEKLRSMFRIYDYIARVGGDKFVIFLINLPDREWALRRADQVMQALRFDIRADGREHHVTASGGLAFSDDAGSTYDELLRRAEIALYVAQEHGHDHYVVFAPDIEDD